MKGLATLGGLIGTGLMAWSKYSGYTASGRSAGSSILMTFTGYDMRAENQDPAAILRRNVETYGPLVGGVVVSKVAAKAGVNRSLPKGINL